VASPSGPPGDPRDLGNSGLARFAEAALGEGIALDQVTLLIGEWDTPGLDVARYCLRLDQIAATARKAIETQPDSSIDRALVISDVLFARMGFRGNAEDYYDPRNSFLGQVLERRLGIPISLSVLFLEIARRVGVLAQGVNFPGHFLVRIAVEDSWRFLDPFTAGRLLSTADLEALLRQSAGPGASLEPSLLSAATKRQIVSRMLVNLAGIYGKHGDLPRSLAVLERLSILDPENPRLLRELAQLRERVDSLN
jgi:regulator of sirC expression with transglutaminase-like and TPR domain